MSRRRVQKRKKATNYIVYGIRSLVMVRATSCQRKGLKVLSISLLSLVQRSSLCKYNYIVSQNGKIILDSGVQCLSDVAVYEVPLPDLHIGRVCADYAFLHRLLHSLWLALLPSREFASLRSGERERERKREIA